MEATHGGVPANGQAATTAQVTAAQSAAQAYADALVAAMFRGNYDASGNVYPSTGGSGTAGAIKKGDWWVVSVGGTLGGSAVEIGDTLRAVADTPGQTAANWVITERNLGYVPENSANKDASGGYPALTGYKINLWNAAKTFKTMLSSIATAARDVVFSDLSGTVMLDTQRTLSVSDLSSGGAICTANQLDSADVFIMGQSTAAKLVNWPTPNDTTKCYKKTIVNNGSVAVWTNLKRVIAPLRSATFTYNPGVGWSADSIGVQELSAQNNYTYPSDTALNFCNLVTMPGGFFGANDQVEIHAVIKNTSGTSGKTLRVQFGAFEPLVASPIVAAVSAYYSLKKTVFANGSTSAQSTSSDATNGSDVSSSGSVVPPTGTVDTSSDVLIRIGIQKVTGGDTTALFYGRVVYYPSP